MISVVRDFIERLKSQKMPVVMDISSISPELDKLLRDEHLKALRGMADAADALEERLNELYEAGADDTAAIAALDEAVAIIRRGDLTDTQRVQKLANLFHR
jgi:hypothetical protein